MSGAGEDLAPDLARGATIAEGGTQPAEACSLVDLPKLRAVVLQEGPWWIAIFLEHYLATMAASLEKLPQEIERILTVQALASAAQGVELFEGYKPAPRRYWRMYEEGRPLESPGTTEMRIFEGDRTSRALRESPTAPSSRQEP